MINSIIHQPCEVSLHLYSSEIFLHPPRPNSELPGDDKTLRGLVEIRVPSERTIQAVKVTLQGHQTLAIPERIGDSPIIQTRYEDKVLLEKVVEIANESRPALSRSSSFKGKGKEKERNDGLLSSTTSSSEIIEVHGIHLEKGTHGFEFAFIIPASSPPFERGRYGRVRYTLTASAIGAGRGKANVTISREILIILNVNADGGPVPLDIQYHDYHEALGAMSVSLTSASLTVGGAATLSIYHPSPPFGLSVHVVRVFVEQTIELYSDVRQAWMKLPAEKLRIWERGFMPYKEANKQIDPSSTMEDCLWISSEDGLSPGRPGRSVIAGGYGVPTLAPYGSTMHPGTTGPLGTSMPGQGSTPSTPVGIHPPLNSNSGIQSPAGDGYKLKAVMRLPDDNVIRPSTVRGSRAEIRVSHELGVEVFFSRKSVIDERPQSESKGKPKVQVFSMRRATIIPSCFATYDAIHLPPYSMESPLSSRPPSPGPQPMSNGNHNRGRGSNGTNTAIRNPLTTHTPPQNATETELDHWKLTQTLRAALGGHANSGSGATPGNTNSTFGIHSTNPSQPGSAMGSRNTSPTRNHHSGPLGYFSSHHGRKSRPSSPTGNGTSSPSNMTNSNNASSGNLMQHSSSQVRRSGTASLHALTPTNKPLVSSLGSANQMTTNSFPIVTTAPASGTTTPKTLPPNSPWAANNFPVRTSTSHESCQCGRSTEELMEAEQRLLEGVPTAPGIWIDAHDEGQLPPPWTPSRPSSPVLDSQDVSGWYRGNDGIREGGRHRGKVGESFENYQDQQSHTLPFTQHSQERHDSDDDGGLI